MRWKLECGELSIVSQLHFLLCIFIFKAFVTLHNDMRFQQTHGNNDEVRRERQRVNHQLNGN